MTPPKGGGSSRGPWSYGLATPGLPRQDERAGLYTTGVGHVWEVGSEAVSPGGKGDDDRMSSCNSQGNRPFLLVRAPSAV